MHVCGCSACEWVDEIRVFRKHDGEFLFLHVKWELMSSLKLNALHLDSCRGEKTSEFISFHVSVCVYYDDAHSDDAETFIIYYYFISSRCFEYGSSLFNCADLHNAILAFAICYRLLSFFILRQLSRIQMKSRRIFELRRTCVM